MKSKGGRPTKYMTSYNLQVYKLALLGATDSDLADFFQVNVDTIHQWKKTKSGFSDSLKRGKQAADSEVALSLYKKAIGYSHPDTDIKVIRGKIVKTKITKHYPPDTIAAIYWLNNRQRKTGNWNNRQGIDLAFENLTEDQLDNIINKLLSKSLPNGKETNEQV